MIEIRIYAAAFSITPPVLHWLYELVTGAKEKRARDAYVRSVRAYEDARRAYSMRQGKEGGNG